jgi:membrane associated rhomboid family serine protease
VPDADADAAPASPTETTCYRHSDRRAGVRCQRCERPICPSCMSTASVGFHCPECTRSGKQKVYTRATLDRAFNRPLVSSVLIAVNVAVFVAGTIYEAGEGVRQAGFERVAGLLGNGGIDRFGFVGGVADGEWWRIVTSGFLHAGLLHLAFNMLALYNIGRVLEPALGRLRFGALYGVSLLTGSLGVLVIDPDALTVGASGAVFGLMGGLVVAQRAVGIDPWSSGVGSVIAINLLITFTIPGISIGGHVGGLLGGLAVSWLLLDAGPKAFTQKWMPVAVAAALGAAAFVAGLLVV